MTERPDDDFSWRGVIVGGYGPNTLYGIAEGAFLPVAALSARSLGASVEVAAGAVVVFAAGSLLANVPAGRLVHRLGERVALLLGGAVGVVGALSCLWATTLWAYLVGVVLLGVAGSVFKLARQSYLARVVPYRRRALAMSTLGGVYRIGLFVGPVLGGLVIARFGLDATFWVVAGGMALGGLLGLFVAGAPADGRRRPAAGVVRIVAEHRRALGTVGLGVTFVGTVRAARTAAIPLWSEAVGLPPEQAAFVFALSALVDVLLFVPAGLATDRFGRRAVTVPAVLVMAVSLMVLPLTGDLVALGVVAVALGIGNGLTAGIIQILGADYAPPQQRAEFLGVWRVLADVGTLGGPAVIAGVTALSALGPGLVVVGATGLVGAGVLHVSLRRPPAG